MATQLRGTFLQRLSDLFRENTATRWEVTSETTFPVFCGEVSERVVKQRHGVFTTEEVFAPEYQLLGWREAGYTFAEFGADDENTLWVTMKHGPIVVRFEYVAQPQPTRYTVELRNANPFKSQELEGYLMEVEGGEGETSFVVRSIRDWDDGDEVPTWDSRVEAGRAIRRLPDAFFMRYDATIVEVKS
jgi:hypothetical protein